MVLKDTVDLMTSPDWQDRMKGEYLQVKIRLAKLKGLLAKRLSGDLDFVTPIPIESWMRQLTFMEGYMHELEYQANVHGIVLPTL